MSGQAHKLTDIGFTNIGILRMNADRGVKTVFGFGKGQHARKIFQSDRYTGRSADARPRHCRKYLGQTFLQFGKIEVAVGVDQHRRFRACESAWTTA